MYNLTKQIFKDDKVNGYDTYLGILAIIYTLAIAVIGWKFAEMQAHELGGGLWSTIGWFIVGLFICVCPPMIFLAVGAWLAFFVFFRFGGYIAFAIIMIRYLDGLEIIEHGVPLSFAALAFSIFNTYATMKAEVKYFG